MKYRRVSYVSAERSPRFVHMQVGADCEISISAGQYGSFDVHFEGPTENIEVECGSMVISAPYEEGGG